MAPIPIPMPLPLPHTPCKMKGTMNVAHEGLLGLETILEKG